MAWPFDGFLQKPIDDQALARLIGSPAKPQALSALVCVSAIDWVQSLTLATEWPLEPIAADHCSVGWKSTALLHRSFGARVEHAPNDGEQCVGHAQVQLRVCHAACGRNP